MLICKPSPSSGDLLELPFTRDIKIILRSFVMQNDQRIISRWFNPSLSKGNWDGSGLSTQDEYSRLMASPDTHCFIASAGELLVARVICHRLETQELGKYIPGRYDDMITELIIAPSVRKVPGLSQKIWQTVLTYIFKFESADRVYTAPVIDDHESGQFLRDAGFRFLENTVIAAGAVSLYLVNRYQFNIRYPEKPQ